MILFGIFSPFPIEGKDGFRQAVQEYFDDYEHAVFTPIDPEFKVVGTTGVAGETSGSRPGKKTGHHSTLTAATRGIGDVLELVE